MAVTLCRLETPEHASHHPCHLTAGGFAPDGERFWFARADTAIAVVATRTGEVVAEWAVAPGSDVLRPKQLVGDCLYMWTDDGIDAWSVPGGARTRLWAAPPRVPRTPAFDGPSGRIAWATRLGTSGPLGARSIVRWLDLATLDGGEQLVPDVIEGLAVLGGDRILATGEAAWRVTPGDPPTNLGPA